MFFSNKYVPPEKRLSGEQIEKGLYLIYKGTPPEKVAEMGLLPEGIYNRADLVREGYLNDGNKVAYASALASRHGFG